MQEPGREREKIKKRREKGIPAVDVSPISQEVAPCQAGERKGKREEEREKTDKRKKRRGEIRRQANSYKHSRTFLPRKQ